MAGDNLKPGDLVQRIAGMGNMRAAGSQSDIFVTRGAIALCVSGVQADPFGDPGTDVYVLYSGRICLTTVNFWRVLK